MVSMNYWSDQMPRRILVSFTAFVWMLAIAEMSHADTLTINLQGVPTAEGTVLIEILGSEAAFKGEEKAVASFMQSAQEGTMSFSLTLPAGSYGARIMHDINDNGELDANFVGIPSEPWGFSNNATGSFGPPKWQDVQFELSGDAEQNIRLNK